MKSLLFTGKYVFFLTAVILFAITGCAHNEVVDQCLTGHTYGFFGGLWHGFIAPFDFIGMLFNKGITMYAQNNNGGLYAFGFLLGSGGWGFFGGKGMRTVRTTRTRTRTKAKNNTGFEDAEVVE